MINRRSRNNNRSANTPRRGGNGGGSGGLSRSHVFDSNGPEVRIRGTAFQVHEKYMALAKDAASVGDRILAENYLQHAEHYQRIINGWMEADASSAPSAYDSMPGPSEGVYTSDIAAAGGSQPAPSSPDAQSFRRPERQGGQDSSRHGGDRRPQYQPRPPAPARETDLGLPPSILGMKPSVRSEREEAPAQGDSARDEFAGA